MLAWWSSALALCSVCSCPEAVATYLYMVIPLLENVGFMCLGGAFTGFFLMSIIGIGYDFACEVSFPVPANNALGVMMSYSHVLSTIQIITLSFVMTEEDEQKGYTMKNKIGSLIACAVLLGCIAIGAVCSAFTKEDLRKVKLDQSKHIDPLLDVPHTDS